MQCDLPCRGWLRPAVPCPAVLSRAVYGRGVPCPGAFHGGALQCSVPCCLVLCRVSLFLGVWWALFTAVPAWLGVGTG